jgi:two-component system, LytTR family, sensor kinase
MTETLNNNSLKDIFRLNAKRKSILISFAVWTILGLSFASESYLRNYKAGRILSVHYFIIEFLTEFYLYALFSILVFKIGKKFPLELKHSYKNFLRSCSVHLPASVVFSFVNVFVSNFIAWTWEDICQDCLTLNMMLDPHFLHRGVIVYWGIIIVGQGLEYYRDLNNEKVRVAQLSAQLSDAQLTALKMQIHPHFLFNTLNSIATLIHEDAESADLMLTRLSDFLRMTLKNSGESMVLLKKELNFVKTYADIEKVRFAERLTVEFSIEESTLSVKVPNLILQPIVENSIKHGLSNKKSNGILRISAKKLKNRLLLEVQDNGQGLDKNFKFDETSGLGLSNTYARLKQVYGDDFLFEITGNKQGTTVKIDLPLTF